MWSAVGQFGETRRAQQSSVDNLCSKGRVTLGKRFQKLWHRSFEVGQRNQLCGHEGVGKNRPDPLQLFRYVL